jgi:hypothetical protein
VVVNRLVPSKRHAGRGLYLSLHVRWARSGIGDRATTLEYLHCSVGTEGMWKALWLAWTAVLSDHIYVVST